MRVAVCVSGAFRTHTDFVESNKMLKAHFPQADFYYATWESYRPAFEAVFPNETCAYFEEPVMHYDPYVDIKKEDQTSPYFAEIVKKIVEKGKLEWSSHHTKQILIHCYLMDTIKQEYDVIIRTRFDVIISDKAKFDFYFRDTLRYNRTSAFATMDYYLDQDPTIFHKIEEHEHTWPDSFYNWWLSDLLIMHPPKVLDTAAVYKLHEEGKLHPAELGWCQVLSGHRGTGTHGVHHRSYHGWVRRYNPINPLA